VRVGGDRPDERDRGTVVGQRGDGVVGDPLRPEGRHRARGQGHEQQRADGPDHRGPVSAAEGDGSGHDDHAGDQDHQRRPSGHGAAHRAQPGGGAEGRHPRIEEAGRSSSVIARHTVT
jgi:hypothetical protein